MIHAEIRDHFKWDRPLSCQSQITAKLQFQDENVLAVLYFSDFQVQWNSVDSGDGIKAESIQFVSMGTIHGREG